MEDPLTCERVVPSFLYREPEGGDPTWYPVESIARHLSELLVRDTSDLGRPERCIRNTHVTTRRVFSIRERTHVFACAGVDDPYASGVHRLEIYAVEDADALDTDTRRQKVCGDDVAGAMTLFRAGIDLSEADVAAIAKSSDIDMHRAFVDAYGSNVEHLIDYLQGVDIATLKALTSENATRAWMLVPFGAMRDDVRCVREGVMGGPWPDLDTWVIPWDFISNAPDRARRFVRAFFDAVYEIHAARSSRRPEADFIIDLDAFMREENDSDAYGCIINACDGRDIATVEPFSSPTSALWSVACADIVRLPMVLSSFFSCTLADPARVFNTMAEYILQDFSEVDNERLIWRVFERTRAQVHHVEALAEVAQAKQMRRVVQACALYRGSNQK